MKAKIFVEGRIPKDNELIEVSYGGISGATVYKKLVEVTEDLLEVSPEERENMYKNTVVSHLTGIQRFFVEGCSGDIPEREMAQWRHDLVADTILAAVMDSLWHDKPLEARIRKK